MDLLEIKPFISPTTSGATLKLCFCFKLGSYTSNSNTAHADWVSVWWQIDYLAYWWWGKMQHRQIDILFSCELLGKCSGVPSRHNADFKIFKLNRLCVCSYVLMFVRPQRYIYCIWVRNAERVGMDTHSINYSEQCCSVSKITQLCSFDIATHDDVVSRQSPSVMISRAEPWH